MTASRETPAARGQWPVIVLLASAGGIDALKRVLSALPIDLPAAVVVLLHLSPDHASVLPDILGRSSKLPVTTARDGLPLSPGSVVVAPSGWHVLATTDLRLALIPSGAFPPSRPSGDLLLATLAVVAGPRVIAVVLTGQGHDGATGATAVHKFGGTVLATDEASSQHFSMPSATIARDHAIDHVVSLDDLPALLITTVTAPELSRDRPGLPAAGA